MATLPMRSLGPIGLLALALPAAPPATAGFLDPGDYPSLGALNLAGGSFTIDTDTVEIIDNGGPVTLFTGVVDDQDGQADSFGGVPGPLGVPEIAVFTFDDITIDSTATVTVTGTRALALLSRGDVFIDALIKLNGGGQQGGSAPTGGAGGSGGFAGGSGDEDGLGPGGGTGAAYGLHQVEAGSGGFGGHGGYGVTYPPEGAQGTFAGGPQYGDLLVNLQGGSGGGGAKDLVSSGDAGGGGGGGAMEVGAGAFLEIGPAGALRADGGFGQVSNASSFTAWGGGGSGGGIRIHGREVSLLGPVSAHGGLGAHSLTQNAGGGRVAIDGSPVAFSVGSSPAASDFTTGINVANGTGSELRDATYGVISVAPLITVVPLSQTFELGTVYVLQDASGSQPGVEVAPGNLQVFGEVTVPPGGAAVTHEIELASLTAHITAADPQADILTSTGVISGAGSVDTTLINDAGGEIDSIGGVLSFAQAVTSNPGAQINGINATLDFAGGLTNDGELNLINTTVGGPIAANAPTGLGGVNTFLGDVTGAGDFVSDGQAVFAAAYDPGGAAPAAVSFGGSVGFDPAAVLVMDVNGLQPGTEHDQLTVTATADLDGALQLNVAPALSLDPGERVELIVAGAVNGRFAQVTGRGDLHLAYLPDAVTLGPPCPADLDGDGDTGITDFLDLLAAWGSPGADLDGDGDTGITDFLALLAAWGLCP